MISCGEKTVIIEPMLVFIDVADNKRMLSVIDFLKINFVDVIAHKKISQKLYDRYIKKLECIPFYEMIEFEKHMPSFIKNKMKKIVFGMLMMENWECVTIMFNLDDIEESNISQKDVPYDVIQHFKMIVQVQKPIYLNSPDSIDLGEVTKNITENDYVNEFSKYYDKFRWMLEKYTPNQAMILDMAYQERKAKEMNEIMIVALDEFPEDEVNLKMNVSGYNEYFDLLEVYGYIHTNT